MLPSDSSASWREYTDRFAVALTGDPSFRCSDELARFVFAHLSRASEASQASTQRETLDTWRTEPVDGRRAGRTVAPPAVDEAVLGAAGPRRPSAWPEGRPFVLCLSHDVDVVTRRVTPGRLGRRVRRLSSGGDLRLGATQVAGLAYRMAREPFRPDPLGRFEEWLALEDRYGFRSTWFFLPERLAAPHIHDMDYVFSDHVTFDGRTMTVAEMMREIGDRGWEVGLHGSYLSAFDADMLADQRQQVATAAHRDVRSIRQHYLQYRVDRTAALHARAGFHCDSTHGFNFSSGFRAETSFPYWCWDLQQNQPTAVLELPLHVMDSALLGASGLGYSEAEAIEHIGGMLDAVEAVGGCLVVNWHPNYIEIPTYWRVYAALLAQAAARGAWGCSCEQLAALWRAREADLQRGDGVVAAR